MPLEIRELHIRVNVNQPEQAKGQQNASMPSAEGKKEEEEKDAVINQCIDEVLDIIKKKKER
jgi:hypothetical protein